MGENNLIDARVRESGAKRVTVQTSLGVFELDAVATVGAPVTLSIRPEHFYTEPSATRIPIKKATVVDAGFFGTHHQCTACIEGLADPVKVRLPQRHIPAPAEQLSLFVDPSELVLLTD